MALAVDLRLELSNICNNEEDRIFRHLVGSRLRRLFEAVGRGRLRVAINLLAEHRLSIEGIASLAARYFVRAASQRILVKLCALPVGRIQPQPVGPVVRQ